MTPAETRMINILKNLKEKYCVRAVKLEFEAEGTGLEEAFYLKNLSNSADLALTVKIGGCEAVRDIFDTKSLGAKNIIAPMIESKYALKKYVNAVKNIFDNIDNTKLFINIETINAFKNLEEITACKEFEVIKGIILGRGDLAASMDFERSAANSEPIFNIAEVISKKMQKMGKDFIIGGYITPDSLSFFENLPYLSGFETRKIVFDKKILSLNDADKGILEAIDFEIEWLKYKQKQFGFKNSQDIKRLEFFEEKYKNKV